MLQITLDLFSLDTTPLDTLLMLNTIKHIENKGLNYNER